MLRLIAAGADSTDPSNSADPLRAAVEHLAAGPDAPPGVCLGVSAGGVRKSVSRGRAQVFDDRGTVAGSPLTTDTRVDIGSVTKILVTTIALMPLVVDSGERLLEHRVAQLLPWAAGQPAGDASLMQLLEHRAGLWEWWPLYLCSHSRTEALEMLPQLPLRYRPDAGRHYSDLGFILLGEVVARLHGSSLEVAASELVLQPFGLVSSSYAVPVPGAAIAASSNGDTLEQEMVRTGSPYPVTVPGSNFTAWREHVLVGEINDGNAFHALGSVSGHAGVFSTVEDLLSLGEMLLASLDGSGPLPRAALRRFLTPGADPAQALGFRCWLIDGEQTWGHTGFPGVGLAIIPRLQAAVVLVSNRLHVRGRPRPTEPMLQQAVTAALIDLRSSATPRAAKVDTPCR